MKYLISTALEWLDSIIVKTAGWRHIPGSKTNFLYLNPYKYKGHTITLKDGTKITKGDWVAEVHLDNKEIKLLDTSYTSLIKLLKGELGTMKDCLSSEPCSKIKAVFGITVFHEIAARQGFTVLDIDNAAKRLVWSYWENILRITLGKRKRKAGKRFITARECWISREQILSGMYM